MESRTTIDSIIASAYYRIARTLLMIRNNCLGRINPSDLMMVNEPPKGLSTAIIREEQFLHALQEGYSR
jgi:hypothetical protein